MTRPRILIPLAILLLGLGIPGYSYLWPKLTLFDPGYRVTRFRSMEKVFPSDPITASSSPAALPLDPRPIAETYRFNGETRDLSGFLRRSETTAFLVLQNGTVVHEAYFQGATAESRLTSFSVAKSFVSTLVGIAHHDGLIDNLSDPITRYVPSLTGSGFDGVAIEDILTMSSGIDFSEIYGDESADIYTIYNKLFLYFRPMTSVISDFGSSSTPGTTFHYASIDTQALGLLIEAVTGRSPAAYLQEKLWHPLGATAPASWLTDQHGTVLSFWGLNATARDFARLGLLFARNGRHEGKQIVPSEWIARATTPQASRLARGTIDSDWGYGYQWWLPRGSNSDFAAIGIWGQFIYVSPETRTVIVKLSADPDFKPHEVEAIAAFRAIAAGLASGPSS